MTAAHQSADQPTRWDMSNVYSSLEGDDYRAAFARLESELAELAAFCDSHGIRRLSEPPAAGAALAMTLVEAIERVNSTARVAETLDSFIHAFVSTNSYDAIAAREASKLELTDTRRRQLHVRLQGWIGSLAPWLDELIAGHETLKRHAFFLKDTARQSQFLMSEELEALAAELCLDAGGAFGKLQGNVTSQLKVAFERDGKTELLPITVIRNLSFDPDPEIRRRAYEVEQQGWASIRTSVAACLNGVKGTAQTLNRRRGRPSVLAASLDQNKIDQPTLDALLGAIREAFPMFRGYLKAKAKKLGKPQLAWWDLFAPLGAAHATYSWRQARDFIVEKFATFHDDLGAYAARAFDSRWIDGAPRDGKRGGAFCMPVVGVDESRILANFDGSFEQVSTLAHELGHGYHNHCQSGLPPLVRGAPSTLAETASIFCETLIAEAALAEASPDEQLMILETQLAGATQVCLDISSRFLFESAVFARREQSELSPDEFCELMLAAQAETYGDGIDPATYHRYMWLWKPHYYSYDHNFYNFPYAFGHLFALGLYAQFQQEGAAFVPRYNELLRATGQDYAAPLAARFGIDITQPDFWRQSLKIVAGQLERFEKVATA
ncbi:MAG TPA: M3 family oligoendopeptidase [Pirellulales bacterium]|nr:M3 family oligoendopeptidase [Pirellulales bacterium]